MDDCGNTLEEWFETVRLTCENEDDYIALEALTRIEQSLALYKADTGRIRDIVQPEEHEELWEAVQRIRERMEQLEQAQTEARCNTLTD